jgi:hypothetical protein
LGQFSKNYRTFYPKIVTKLSKIWVWDPGSEIRDPDNLDKNLFRIPDAGVKKAPDPGSATLSVTKPAALVIKNSKHCFEKPRKQT